MKKFIILLLIVMMSFTLGGCKKGIESGLHEIEELAINEFYDANEADNVSPEETQSSNMGSSATLLRW